MPYHLELGSGDNKMHDRAFVVNSRTGEHKSHNPIPIERAEAQKRVLEGVDDNNKKIIEREDNKKVIERESMQDNKQVQEEEGKKKLEARIKQGAKNVADKKKKLEAEMHFMTLAREKRRMEEKQGRHAEVGGGGQFSNHAKNQVIVDNMPRTQKLFDEMATLKFKGDKYKLDHSNNHLYYLNANGNLGRFAGIWRPELHPNQRIDWVGKFEPANDKAKSIREMQRLADHLNWG